MPAVLGFTQEERNVIEQMDIDTGSPSDVAAVEHFLLPGEEGFDLSHEGGEYKVFDGLVHEIAQASGQFVSFSLQFHVIQSLLILQKLLQ